MGFKRRPKGRGNPYEERRARQRKAAEKKAAWLKPFLEREKDWDLATGTRDVAEGEDYGLKLRAVTRLTKKAVQLLFPERACSVRRDRGTAYGWVDIRLELHPDQCRASGRDDPYRFRGGTRDVRQYIKDTLIALGIAYGTYRSDQPPDYEKRHCLAVSVNETT